MDNTQRHDSDSCERMNEAFERIIKDTHGHFDDCLADRLLELMPNDFYDYRLTSQDDTKLLEDMDKINTKRLCKYLFYSNIFRGPLKQSVMDAFLKELPLIVKSNKASNIFAMLSLLDRFMMNERQRDYCLDYCRSIGNSECCDHWPPETKSLVGLIGLCLQMNQAYQVQDKAKSIFKRILELCYTASSTSSQCRIQAMAITRNLLLDRRMTPIFAIITEIFEKFADRPIPEGHLIHQLRLILVESFEKTLDMPDAHRRLTMIAKILATAGAPADYVIDQLRSRDNLEAMISFATHSRFFDRKELLPFVFYPILKKCDTEEADVLIGKLIMTREEKGFIDRHLQDKLVLQCLESLHTEFSDRCISLPGTDWQVYMLDVSLEYFRSHYHSPLAFKNLVVCLAIINKGWKFLSCYLKTTWLSKLINITFGLLEQTDFDTFHHKPILLRLINLFIKCLLSRNSLLSRVNQKKDTDIAARDWNRALDLINSITDLDTLCEIAQCYKDFESLDILEKKEYLEVRSSDSLDLVWKHFIPKALAGNHAGLIADSSLILLRMDVRCPDETFKKSGLKKHLDIPRFLTQILNDYKHVHVIVEQIIDGVASPFDREEFVARPDSYNYLNLLEVRSVPQEEITVVTDNFIASLCRVLKGECLDEVRVNYMIVLYDFMKLLKERESKQQFAQRLARSDLLGLYHDIFKGQLYSGEAKSNAELCCRYIGTNIDMRVEQFESLIKPHCDRAEELSRFYKSQDMQWGPTERLRYYHCIRKPAQEIGLQSYLDEILDSNRVPIGILECY